jgi:hypothetical protein
MEDDLKDAFEPVRSIMHESHDRRSVVKCKECGQLYFYEFHEDISFSGGGDSQYETYIPVETEEEIEALSKTTYTSILEYLPRLLYDKSSEGNVSVLWVGK